MTHQECGLQMQARPGAMRSVVVAINNHARTVSLQLHEDEFYLTPNDLTSFHKSSTEMAYIV